MNIFFAEASEAEEVTSYLNMDVRQGDVDQLTNAVVTDVNIYLVLKNISYNTEVEDVFLKPFESETYIQFIEDWDVYNIDIDINTCPNTSYSMIIDDQASDTFEGDTQPENCSRTIKPAVGSLTAFNGYDVNQIWQLMLEFEGVILYQWCLEFEYYIYEQDLDSSDDTTSSTSETTSNNSNFQVSRGTIVGLFVFIGITFLLVVSIGICLIKCFVIDKIGKVNENSVATMSMQPKVVNNNSSGNQNNIITQTDGGSGN